MRKTLIGPKLRQLRRANKQTQSDMAKALGVSTAYINLLENNNRSLSVKMLVSIADIYGLDLRELVKDDTSTRLADIRNAIQDPVFEGPSPDLQELRAAIDHAPRFVSYFLQLHRNHRNALEKFMRLGSEGMPDDLMAISPEAIIHDFFRGHSNHFDDLETASEELRSGEPFEVDEVYAFLKARLKNVHGIDVQVTAVEVMNQSLRYYDEDASIVRLSEALDHQNRVFQLAHVLCFLEYGPLLESLTEEGGLTSDTGKLRCHVELANYFAAAFLMPYAPFIEAAEACRYDVDRLAARSMCRSNRSAIG